MSLEAIRYRRGELTVLDQLRLPHTTVYVPIATCADAFAAIKHMVVRGAPAIAIVAALALAVELYHSPGRDAAWIRERLDYLVGGRPTAVNLGDAARKLKALVAEAEAKDGSEGAREAYLVAAEKMLEDDVRDNRNIGDFGAEWLIAEVSGEGSGKGGGIEVLTHCNTGSLATAGYGTALGIIRSLHAKSSLKHAYCTETRPYNQGSRLTAYELVHDLPAGKSTLITDSMAASLLQQRNVKTIIVGADRVARNGDTANKIGTYQLAIVAKHHGVKFVVAAPTTSIDLSTASGKDIVIEHRPSNEVLTVSGPVVTDVKTLQTDEAQGVKTVIPGIAKGIEVFNPSFDVTPKDLIDAIVTEKGVAVKDASGEFGLERFF